MSTMLHQTTIFIILNYFILNLEKLTKDNPGGGGVAEFFARKLGGGGGAPFLLLGGFGIVLEFEGKGLAGGRGGGGAFFAASFPELKLEFSDFKLEVEGRDGGGGGSGGCFLCAPISAFTFRQKQQIILCLERCIVSYVEM